MSKIFGRSKKKKKQSQSASEPTKKPVSLPSSEPKKTSLPAAQESEYATFSGQFPPPEWVWYENQVEKQDRTYAWLRHQRGDKQGLQDTESNYMNMRTGQLFQGNQGKQGNQGHPRLPCVDEDGHYCQIEFSQQGSTLPSLQHQNPSIISNSELYLEPQSLLKQEVVYTNYGNYVDFPAEDQYVRRRHSESHKRRSKHHHNAHRHSGEWRQSLVSNGTKEDAIDPSYPYHIPNKNAPQFSSTPKVHQHHKNQHHDDIDTLHNNTIDESYAGRVVSRGREHHKKSHSRHRNSHHYKSQQNDISYEYNGKRSRKKLHKAVSRDSGVNCLGVDALKARNAQPVSNVKVQSASIINDGNAGDDELEVSFTPTPGDSGYSDGQKDITPDNKLGKENGNVEGCMENVNTIDKLDLNEQDSCNQVVCVADINYCAPKYILTDQIHDCVCECEPEENVCMETKQEVENNQQEVDGCDVSYEGDLDSVIEESEQSYETVIESPAMKQNNLCQKVTELNLGDSGFSSPRTDENVIPCGKVMNSVMNTQNVYRSHEYLSAKNNNNLSQPTSGSLKVLNNITHNVLADTGEVILSRDSIPKHLNKAGDNYELMGVV